MRTNYQGSIDTSSTQINDGGQTALSLFHTAAERVPAYKDFLSKAGIAHEKIKTIEDFTKYVPIIDKQSYISQYPLAELCMDGRLSANRIISGSSGSSGAPFFWPRGYWQDQEGTEMFGEVYDRIFDMEKHSTLLVICYAMGMWIAGTFALTTALSYIDKGRPVNVITPGIDKEEAAKAIKQLAPNYDQVVLVGYPPIVKDVITESQRIGVDWKNIKTRLLLSSEAFSEEWRDYVLETIRSDDPYRDTSSIYGTADAGIFGIETPASTLVRRLYNHKPDLKKDLFGTHILPTLVQYEPKRRYFEEVNGELIFTSNAGLPLIRYNTQDSGGVLSFAQVVNPVGQEVSRQSEALNINLREWNRPFLFVNGRKLFVITLYGANIYPENIKAGLLDSEVRDLVTGKFTMVTKNASDMDQYLEINVELAQDVLATGSYEERIARALVDGLRSHNMEYHKLEATIGENAHPHIKLVPFGDPEHFAAGVKHKWVKKAH
jgi:phenylacetate-CoA ligase